jgi:hypothetical protein
VAGRERGVGNFLPHLFIVQKSLPIKYLSYIVASFASIPLKTEI